MKYFILLSDKMRKELIDIYPLVIGAQEDVLRAIASPIRIFDKALRFLAKDLLSLMWQYDGVGLAAPQIGKSIRMFAYTQRDTNKKNRKLLEEGVMINPKLIHMSEENCIENEWCLSLPGIEWEVERAIQVIFWYMDTQGKQQVKKASGYNARILLHELDHLDGILFIDRASKVRKKGKK